METVIYLLGELGTLEIHGGSIPAVGDVIESIGQPRGASAVITTWRVEHIERNLRFALIEGQPRSASSLVFVTLTEAP